MNPPTGWGRCNIAASGSEIPDFLRFPALFRIFPFIRTNRHSLLLA
jgi:hypothetical protein